MTPAPRRSMSRLVALVVAAGVVAVGVAGVVVGLTAVLPADALGPVPPATPKARCGPGSRPELGIQGRVSAAEVTSGRAVKGYTCNTELVGRYASPSAGFKVERFIDKAGHECAYYDSALVFPTNGLYANAPDTGVYVLDMANPAKPVRTAVLRTPAMQSPHESMLLNEKRGLLVAAMGHIATLPGIIDIYDVNADCRQPVLKASLPMGLLGHESGMAPDGNTFYTTSIDTGNLTAVDISNPSLPIMIYTATKPYDIIHGLSVSDDGNRAYLTASPGLVILDTSQIQRRVPNPQVKEVSTLAWSPHSIGQVTIPVTIRGRSYLVEVDEYATATDETTPLPTANGPRVGAARIIDIADETKPRVVSDMRLAVNQPENRPALAGDPGASEVGQGYAGHYCAVPRRQEPEVVACSFIMSGLRLFDIRDPLAPKEIAYSNYPSAPASPKAGFGVPGSAYAMSSAAFVPERAEIWYSDSNSGFYAVRVTNGAWPFAARSKAAAKPRGAARGAAVRPVREPLPATGDGRGLGLGLVGALLAGGLALRTAATRRRRPARTR